MTDNNKQTTEISTKLEPTPKRPLLPIIVDHQSTLGQFLPDHIVPEKFFLIANSVLKGNKYLRDCLNQKKGVNGFLDSLKNAAMDGLLPDGKREAAIVPYGGVPTYVRMYGGMLKMMRQSGIIADISTGLVCENDEFDWCRGTENYVRHKVAFSNRGKKIAAWCVIRTKDGGEYFDIMGADDINQIKSAARAKNGPWSNAAHEGQMWRKTVLRRTANLAPLSTDLHNAFAKEDEENYDFDHMQKPTARERLISNMGAKDRGSVIDINAADVQDATVIDVEPVDEPAPAKVDKILLPRAAADMTGEEWEQYALDLVADLSKRGITGEAFDALYKVELDQMADLSPADFDRVLDAMQGAAA